MRLAPFLATLTVLTLALVGCAKAPVGAPEPAGSSVPASESASSPSADPTPEPAESETEAEPEASAEPPSATASDTPSADPTSSADEEDVDLQAGIRTNDFTRLPKELGDMHQTSLQTDPRKHQVLAEYIADDEQSRAVVIAHIPFVDGDPAPVTSPGDAGYRQSVQSAAEALREDGKGYHERSVTAGGLDWACMEATEAQGGRFDHNLCAAIAHGRMIELQRIAFPDDDQGARDAHTDELLADLGEGVLSLGR